MIIGLLSAIVVVAGFCFWQGIGSAWIAADVTNPYDAARVQ